MLYRRKLELDVEEIRPELNIVRNATQELKSSLKFKQVLQVSRQLRALSTKLICISQGVLTVGNALNNSSFRGGARGFQLEALLKVRPTQCAGTFTNSLPVERNEDGQRRIRLPYTPSLSSPRANADGSITRYIHGGTTARRGCSPRYVWRNSLCSPAHS
jgi:hypothetical protein